MEKFVLQNVEKSFLNLKMRDLFKLLIDVNVEDPETGYLKSIPSNYGYVSFWYGWLNNEALEKYFKDYIPKDKLKKIETAKKEKGELFDLRDHIRDYLFPIARDHPDTIGGGHVEACLAILFPSFEEVTLDEAISLLKRQLDKLQKLKDFKKDLFDGKIKNIDDMEWSFEKIEFIDPKVIADGSFWEDYDEYEYNLERLGCEIRIRVDFDADDTLKKIIQKIDEGIAPLKGTIDEIVRLGSSFHPF